MATRKNNHTTTNGSNRSGQTNRWKAPYATRYVAVDSHLTERNGYTDSVYGLAGERPAGRKLAQDIANACNQLHSEGYEVVSITPLTSGRAVEARVKAGRASRAEAQVFKPILAPIPLYEEKNYVDTGVGYSVTDGVVITAKLRE